MLCLCLRIMPKADPHLGIQLRFTAKQLIIVLHSLKLWPHEGSIAPDIARTAIFASSSPALLSLKKQNRQSWTKSAKKLGCPPFYREKWSSLLERPFYFCFPCQAKLRAKTVLLSFPYVNFHRSLSTKVCFISLSGACPVNWPLPLQCSKCSGQRQRKRRNCLKPL